MNASNHETILRKIGEDPILRPFLSSLFDNETYINHIIQEKKSEECLGLIANSTELINEEIQRYITENRDILMSGMQDVASLANQYQGLADHSKLLQGTIHRLKKDVAESYDMVKTKTQELERIHETNFILNQLRQFVKTKAQLTQYLKNQDDKDTRSLAGAARTIAELEKLLAIPQLLEIKLVNNSVQEIKKFSSNIRLLSQTNLFRAIEEKNQLEISNYLQVFYNLESLPEISLLIVDYLVKKTIEASREELDFSDLHRLYQDHLNKSGTTSTPSTSSGLTLSASKKSLTSLSASASSSAASGTVTVAQLRIAMKELGHIWSSLIYDKATQIMVFQRVLWKKEDPVSHEKFLNVFKLMKLPATTTTSNSSSGNDPLVTHQFLSQGELLSLFWHRLSLSLQDVCFEKLKEYPAITNRAYLCLRKSLAEILTSIDYWQEEELQRNLGPSMKFMKALTQAYDPQFRDMARNVLSDTDDDVLTLFSDQYTGMFGSLAWRNEDILCSTYVTKQLGMNAATLRSLLNKPSSTPSSDIEVKSRENDLAIGEKKKKESGKSLVGGVDHPLLLGLKPFHDRYLMSALERMNVPITQMFPELDGYIAAIPSKRDLQTFIKAIQQEFIMILVESDESIIFAICREFLKINRLMLSKIQNLILHTQESRKISSTAIPSTTSGTSTPLSAQATNVLPSSASNTGSSMITFQRNNAQEQNLQLFILLLQLKEALEKIPLQIMKYLDENALLVSSSSSSSGTSRRMGFTEEKTSLSSSYSSSSSSSQSVMMKEVQKTMSIGIFHLYECMIRDLISPIIEMITDYCLSLLLPLQKEGVFYVNHATTSVDAMNLECSLAVQNLVRQLPALLKAYLFCLPKNYSSRVLDYAMEEITLRILQAYISVVSLTKPFTEMTKLKIAKDLLALEEVLSTYCSTFQSATVQKSMILEEYRSFRRYLFEEGEAGIKLSSSSSSSEKGNKSVSEVKLPLPPKISLLVGLDYISALRPSVLIGYLIANGPNQLPLPFEMAEKDFGHYLTMLLLNYQQSNLSKGNTAELDGARGGVDGQANPLQRIEKEIHQFFDQQETSTLLLEYAQASTTAASSMSSSMNSHRPTIATSKKEEEIYLDQLLSQLFQKNILSAHLLYPKEMTAPMTSNHSTLASAGNRLRSLAWKQHPNERQNWECVQKGLDVLFQRITVLENAEQKQQLRLWYEAIMDLGSQYFA